MSNYRIIIIDEETQKHLLDREADCIFGAVGKGETIRGFFAGDDNDPKTFKATGKAAMNTVIHTLLEDY